MKKDDTRSVLRMRTLRATLKESRTQPSDSSREARDQDPCWSNIYCSRYSDTLHARRFVHPTLGHHTTLHSDTTSGYTLRYSLRSTVAPRTLHSDPRAPLHPDTTSGCTRAPDSRSSPVRAKTLLLHSPCSGLVFTEG